MCGNIPIRVLNQKTKISRKVPHKPAMKKSADRKNNLELFQDPPYRRLFCHRCNQEVILCLFCDRCQKYCKTCKKESKRESNKTSNNKYRRTFKGRKSRAACEKRRRVKISKKVENLDSYKIMGEKSSNSPKDLQNIKNKGEVAPEGVNFKLGKGDTDASISESKASRDNTLGFSSQRRNHKRIFCSLCGKQCSIYSYQNIFSKQIYKKEYWRQRNKEKYRYGEL